MGKLLEMMQQIAQDEARAAAELRARAAQLRQALRAADESVIEDLKAIARERSERFRVVEELVDLIKTGGKRPDTGVVSTADLARIEAMADRIEGSRLGGPR
jgi:hypothetical protein